VFDPAVVSYRDLLRVFFTIHDPTTRDRQGADVGPQYRSAIFYHSAEQRAVAAEVIADVAKVWDDPIVTEIAPLERFYPAEEYHRDYYRRHPEQGYCRLVIAPNAAEVLKEYLDKLKPGVHPSASPRPAPRPARPRLPQAAEHPHLPGDVGRRHQPLDLRPCLAMPGVVRVGKPIRDGRGNPRVEAQLPDVALVERVRPGVIIGPVVRGLLVGHQVRHALQHEIEVVGADDRRVHVRERAQPRHRRERALERGPEPL